MIAVAAQELGISREQVRVMPTSTDKVPNTSATAASCGTDLNGAAVKNACEILRARLAPVAAKLLKAKTEDLMFADSTVYDRRRPKTKLTLAELTRKAYMERVS